jgi:serine/threonine protein kinase
MSSPRYVLSPGPGQPESHRIPKRILQRKTPLRVEAIPDAQETARMKIDKPGVGFDPTPYGERIGGGVYGRIYRCRVTKNFMEDLKRAFNAGGVKVFESFPAIGSFVMVKVVRQKKNTPDKEFFEESAHENTVHSKLATMRCSSSNLACISNFVPEFYVSFVSKLNKTHECITLMGSAGVTTIRKMKGISAEFYARAEQAVCALWLAGYIHGDLHLENIMTDDKGNVKLIDFGFAAKMPESFVTFISQGVKQMIQSGSDTSLGDLWTEGKMNGTQTVVDYSNRLMKGRDYTWYNPDYKSLRGIYNNIPRGGKKLLPGIRSKLWDIPMSTRDSPLENEEIRQSPVIKQKWVPANGKYWADEPTPSTYRPTPKTTIKSSLPRLLSRTLPVLPKTPPPKKLAPVDRLDKVNVKGRKVYKNIAGRTYVKQGDKKVYVKKLFTPKRNAAVATVAPKIAPAVASKIAPASSGRSPMINTEKVDAKKRKVFRNSKGRTYVKQGDKKVYVKKLFTPKRNSPVPNDGFKIAKTTQDAYNNGVRVGQKFTDEAEIKRYKSKVAAQWPREFAEEFADGFLAGSTWGKNIDFDEKPPKAQKKERGVSIRKPRTEAQAFADGVRIARAKDGKAREYQEYVYDHWDRGMVESFDRGLNAGYERVSSPVQPKLAPATSPSINTQKVNAKKRKVFRDTKGRTFVRQGDKKVYVKKLFTPK